MNRRVVSLIAAFTCASIVCAQGPASGVITDGQVLADGLDLFAKSQTGASVTWPEAAKGSMAISYAQAFVSACYVWQRKAPKGAPFDIPRDLTPEQFVKDAHKYLKEHPERLHARADIVLFDAIVALYPRK